MTTTCRASGLHFSSALHVISAALVSAGSLIVAALASRMEFTHAEALSAVVLMLGVLAIPFLLEHTFRPDPAYLLAAGIFAAGIALAPLLRSTILEMGGGLSFCLILVGGLRRPRPLWVCAGTSLILVLSGMVAAWL